MASPNVHTTLKEKDISNGAAKKHVFRSLRTNTILQSYQMIQEKKTYNALATSYSSF